MESAIAYVLGRDPATSEISGVEVWWARHLAARSGLSRPFDRAAAGGFSADRLGYAFASGYVEALAALLPSEVGDARLALCVTERGGGHPRNVQTTLRPKAGGGFVVDGLKTYATLSTFATALLVAVREGEGPDGVPRLRVVRVAASAPGVSFEPLRELPFVPEIPHAEVSLEQVSVPADAVLPGDGYLEYIKPFRTVEDLHVHGALLGYLVSLARRSGWPRESIARATALLAALRDLSTEPPLAPATHVALAGVIELARAFLRDAAPHLELAPADERARFERDRGLLEVAGKARGKRLEAAWRALG